MIRHRAIRAGQPGQECAIRQKKNLPGSSRCCDGGISC